ncbi:RecQ family ATP-dependent DNA helicase [Deinococcus misasensis]|uniref:RecQ family ATP-dependent DNA helicase n=1 Tax=Deinococcus misasensis TaxID=392413 RepID=UPI00054EC680|nr:RecQ family ATP-dependent DNA helicase [Deinococcus misasensis]
MTSFKPTPPHATSHPRYTPEDQQWVVKAIEQGLRIPDLARHLERSESGILSFLARYGMLGMYLTRHPEDKVVHKKFSAEQVRELIKKPYQKVPEVSAALVERQKERRDQDEDLRKKLLAELESGATAQEVARRHGRTLKEVYRKLHHLGLVETLLLQHPGHLRELQVHLDEVTYAKYVLKMDRLKKQKKQPSSTKPAPLPEQSPTPVLPNLTLQQRLERPCPVFEGFCAQHKVSDLHARQALKQMQKRKVMVLIRRHGWFAAPRATLEELAAELQVSKERVRQLQAKSEKALIGMGRRLKKQQEETPTLPTADEVAEKPEQVQWAEVQSRLPAGWRVMDLEVTLGGELIEGVLVGREQVWHFTANDAPLMVFPLLDTRVLVGHNLRRFDLPHLRHFMQPSLLSQLGERVLDTLELCSLVFPGEPTQALEKPYREYVSQSDPLEDTLETHLRFEKARAQIPQLSPVLHQAARRLLPVGPLRDLFDEVDAVWPPELHNLKTHLWSLPLQREENLGALIYLSWALQQDRVSHRRPAWTERTFEGFAEAERHHQPLNLSEAHLTRELQSFYGEEYRFREGQLEIVQALMKGETVPLGLLPTGGGKSLTFQFPALFLSKHRRGLTVVVCPLQALMEDQVLNLQLQLPQWAERAAFLSGTQSPEEQRKVLDGVWEGRIDLLYVSPERLRNVAVQGMLRHRQPHLWVLDEAHTLSQWGMDFRPDFLRIPRIIRDIHEGGQLPLLGFVTATATQQVVSDLQEKFVQELQPLLGRPMQKVPLEVTFRWRSEIQTEVRQVPRSERLKVIVEKLHLAREQGVSIVYVQSRMLAESYAQLLEEQGFLCRAFHARITPAEKRAVLQQFKDGELEVVVATSAFGMGIDRAGIHTVIHAGPPSSPESYLQEIGRVARKPGETGHALLLWDDRDFQMLFEHEKNNRIGSEKALKDTWNVVKKRLSSPPLHRWVSSFELSHLLPQDDPEALVTQSRVALFALERYELVFEGEQRPAVLKITLHPSQQKLGVEGRKLLKLFSHHSTRMGVELQVDIREAALLCSLTPARVIRGLGQLVKSGHARWSYQVSLRVRRGAKGRLDAVTASVRAFLAHLTEEPDVDLQQLHLEQVNADLMRRGKQARLHLALKAASSLGLSHTRMERLTARITFTDPDLSVGGWAMKFDERYGQFRGFALEVLEKMQEVGEGLTLNVAELEQHFPPSGDLTVLDGLGALQVLGVLDFTRGDFEQGSVFHLKAGTRPRYNAVAYRPLEQHYENRARRLHAMREILKQPDEAERTRLITSYFTEDLQVFCERHLPYPETAGTLQIPEFQHKILSNLSDTQRQIVLDSTSRALLVLAGPGSGKTRTIVHRVANLVALRGVPAERVLVLAYNRTAVAEVRERISELIGELSIHVDVFTFHGLARKLTGLSEKDAPDTLKDPQQKFDWILKEAIQHLKEHDSPYQYVLVDEYQDIKTLEYQFVTLLARFDGNADEEESEQRGYLVAVGDDDQNLYSFQGADIRFIHQFQEDYQVGQDKVLTLSTNHRSGPGIVKVANRFIEFTIPHTERLKGEHNRITSQHETGGEVRLGRYTRRLDAAFTIAQEIQRLLQKEVPPEEIAVVARTWEELSEVQHFLREKGIRVQLLNVHDQLRPVSSLVGREVQSVLLEDKGKVSEDPRQTLEDTRLLLNLSSRDHSWPALLDSVSKLTRPTFEQMALRMENTRPISPQGVVLSTYHSAKGCEFEQVFVLSENVPPEATRDDTRALYVALTRAKRGLHVLRHEHTCHPALKNRDFQLGLLQDGVTPFPVQAPAEDPTHLTFEIMPDPSDFYLSSPRVVHVDGRLAVRRFAQQWGPLELHGNLVTHFGQPVAHLSKHSTLVSRILKYQSQQGKITPVGHMVMQCLRDDEWYERAGYEGPEDHHHLVLPVFRVTLPFRGTSPRSP